tara:strand:- start:8526 stop:8684 length:159 start_codon:yes stop_codon:yes gene_type:complete
MTYFSSPRPPVPRSPLPEFLIFPVFSGALTVILLGLLINRLSLGHPTFTLKG